MNGESPLDLPTERRKEKKKRGADRE